MMEYDAGSAHYQLWKPCFPRGEAPPPYEEAVALSQAEAALNASNQTCTVSVATHHRTLPLNICAETAELQQPIHHHHSGYPVANPNTLTSTNSGNNGNVLNGGGGGNLGSNNITTNLINININNAGTITSLATGENHQISPAITAITNNHQATTTNIINPNLNNK